MHACVLVQKCMDYIYTDTHDTCMDIVNRHHDCKVEMMGAYIREGYLYYVLARVKYTLSTNFAYYVKA